MIKIKAPFKIAAIFFSLVLLTSCDGDSQLDDSMPGSDFERGAMLEAIANDLIIPNFKALEISVDEMRVATSNFIQNTNQNNLDALRASWQKAVIDHQHCSAFGFGPGERLLGPYASVLGVFPVDESQVEANIVNPNFNLPNSFNTDIRGFYAIEYLIYGKNLSDIEVLTSFDEDRKNYLELLVSELQTEIRAINEEWENSYMAEFAGNTGTSAGSPTSLLYNSWVKDYENLKNFKIELPAGLTAGQESGDGTLVEAYYSGISKDLLFEHWQSSKNIYLGLSRDGETSIGWEEYSKTVIGGTELAESTIRAISDIDVAMSALPEGLLSENIESAEVIELRDALQANTANFKSSLSSLLGISITFNSGDGD